MMRRSGDKQSVTHAVAGQTFIFGKYLAVNLLEYAQ